MVMEWHAFDGLITADPLPPEHRHVLVQIAASTGPAPTHPASVAVGYLNYGAGDKDSPYFVVTGFGRPFTVTHWCDCLGDDFRAPLWAFGQEHTRTGLTPAQMALRIQELERRIADITDAVTGAADA